jgi:hypothetical protein
MFAKASFTRSSTMGESAVSRAAIAARSRTAGPGFARFDTIEEASYTFLGVTWGVFNATP